MGKGFNNFMSKKDFHPSAIWNIKRVWEAQQKKDHEKKLQEEMKLQYQKEQEMLDNRMLLGGDKDKLALAFMYEPPTGIKKDEDETPAEPKFEWQRKYNAPRESWAKGNEELLDQPFGIEVRNVRCCRCHTWGHINTDRDCPLYNMSGGRDDPGYCTNPSDIIRTMRKVDPEQPCSSRSLEAGGSQALVAVKKEEEPRRRSKDGREEEEDERRNARSLNANMREEYGLKLRANVMDNISTEEALEQFNKPANEQDMMQQMLSNLSDKERRKIFKKFYKEVSGGGSKVKKIKKEKKNGQRGSYRVDEPETPRFGRVKREPMSPPRYDRAPRDQRYDDERHLRRSPRFKQEPPSSRRQERRQSPPYIKQEPPSSRREQRHSPPAYIKQEPPSSRRSDRRSPPAFNRRSPSPPRRRNQSPERRRQPSASPPQRRRQPSASPPERRRQPSTSPPERRRRSRSESVERRHAKNGRERSRSPDRRRRR